MLKTKKKSSPPQIVEFECISDQKHSIILTTEERIAVSVNYSCSFTNSCIRVTALLEYLDFQVVAASCIHYTIMAAAFAAQLALNYPSNLQLEGPSFWSCEAP